MKARRSWRWVLWKLARGRFTFLYPIPDYRKCFIEAENRFSIIGIEQRITAIELEDRIVTITADNRFCLIEPENRIAKVG